MCFPISGKLIILSFLEKVKLILHGYLTGISLPVVEAVGCIDKIGYPVRYYENLIICRCLLTLKVDYN